MKCGCSKCAGVGRKNLTDFIERSTEVHGDKYDYRKVEYHNSETKVCIICPEHGEFWQRPYGHWIGYGCQKCAGVGKLTLDEFIARSRGFHGNKYDYSKVNYENCETKVCIICPKHDEFWQRPADHCRGRGCQECYEDYMLGWDDLDDFAGGMEILLKSE